MIWLPADCCWVLLLFLWFAIPFFIFAGELMLARWYCGAFDCLGLRLLVGCVWFGQVNVFSSMLLAYLCSAVAEFCARGPC